jgi:hypothetical protein
LSKNNFPILLALLSVFSVAYVIHGCISVARGRMPEATMDVGQGREQDAEAFQQELHNAAMRPLLRLEDEQHCCCVKLNPGLWNWAKAYEISQCYPMGEGYSISQFPSEEASHGV